MLMTWLILFPRWLARVIGDSRAGIISMENLWQDQKLHWWDDVNEGGFMGQKTLLRHQQLIFLPQ